MEGILLVDKPIHKTSFYLVSYLRKLTKVKKIGHAGTLDPLATGVMVMLIGRNYTKRSNEFLSSDKEYTAEILLGSATTTYDSEGESTNTSNHIPTLEELEAALQSFQGTCLQTPPMYSAKKVNGQKLYNLARKGQVIERQPVEVNLETTLLDYTYPSIKLHIKCSKGTYIRSIAHDLGLKLNTFGHLTALRRTRSGAFHIDACHPLETLTTLPNIPLLNT